MNLKLISHPNFYKNIILDETPLKKFHSQYLGTFQPLPANGKIKELIVRIATVIIAPLVYLAWTIQLGGKFFLKGAIKPVQTVNYTPTKKRDTTPNTPSLPLQIPQDLPSKLKTISIIKKSRLDDVNQELKRLRNNATLSSNMETTIDNTLSKINSYRQYGDPQGNESEVKMLLGRTLEIKRQFQDTHYVFTHGQSSQWYAVSCLIKELVKRFDPSRNVHHFKFLRIPQIANDNKINDWKEIMETASNSSILNDHIPEVRESLLSVDAHLFNAEKCESALNFLSRNYSVMSRNDSSSFKNACTTILSKFAPNKSSEINDLANKVVDLSKKINQVCGNLFVICVPKKMVDATDNSILYRAHPFGAPCHCEFENRDIEILDELQKDELIYKSYCDQQPIPQYRLMTVPLKPENGVHSFLLTPFKKSLKKSLKNEIAKIATDTYQFSQGKVSSF